MRMPDLTDFQLAARTRCVKPPVPRPPVLQLPPLPRSLLTLSPRPCPCRLPATDHDCCQEVLAHLCLPQLLEAGNSTWMWVCRPLARPRQLLALLRPLLAAPADAKSAWLSTALPGLSSGDV